MSRRMNMQQSSLTPMLISIAVFLAGALLLLVRAVYDAAAGVSRARKEYRALLANGLISEAKENDRQLARKLRRSGSRKQGQAGSAEDMADAIRPDPGDSGPVPALSPSPEDTVPGRSQDPAPDHTVPRTSAGSVPYLNEAGPDRGIRTPAPGPYPETAELIPISPSKAPFLRERRDP